MKNERHIDSDGGNTPQGRLSNRDHEKQCRYCSQPIDVDASVCWRCSRHQNRFTNWYVQYLGQLGILASIVLVVIALSQLLVAHKERIVASTAAEIAREAKALNDFTMTVIKAQNDDREALDALRIWANDSRFPFKEQAQNAFVSVISGFGGPIEPGYARLTWPEGTDRSRLSISQLRDLYDSVSPIYHAHLVVFLWNRGDIPKADRIGFLIEVLKGDASQKARFYAGKFLSEEAGLEWRPFHVDPLLGWWDESMKRTGQ